LKGAQISAKAADRLPPDEARAWATVLREHADFLGGYRAEIADAEQALGTRRWLDLLTRTRP
jgi:hypothetical protein